MTSPDLPSSESRPDDADVRLRRRVTLLAEALASNDVRALERDGSPYRHRWPGRMLFRAAAMDPRCSSTATMVVAASILLSLVISAAWQIAAVYVAGRYEMGIEATTPLLIAGVAVALLVVSFDWDIIHKRINGETRVPMLLVRFLFVLIMALLVSEAVAGWVFDKDIKGQVAAAADARRQEIADRKNADAVQLSALNARLAPLNKAVESARTDLDRATTEMTRQADGLLGAQSGRGPLYEGAALRRQMAADALARARTALAAEAVPNQAEQRRILEAESAYIAARPIVGPDQVGPGERERLLWEYLLANPDALWLRRVPLAVVMIVLDLFAVIIGWSVGRSIRERHHEWAERTAELRARSVRLSNAVLDTGEVKVFASLGRQEEEWTGANGRMPVSSTRSIDVRDDAYPDPYRHADPHFLSLNRPATDGAAVERRDSGK